MAQLRRQLEPPGAARLGGRSSGARLRLVPSFRNPQRPVGPAQVHSRRGSLRPRISSQKPFDELSKLGRDGRDVRRPSESHGQGCRAAHGRTGPFSGRAVVESGRLPGLSCRAERLCAARFALRPARIAQRIVIPTACRESGSLLSPQGRFGLSTARRVVAAGAASDDFRLQGIGRADRLGLGGEAGRVARFALFLQEFPLGPRRRPRDQSTGAALSSHQRDPGVDRDFPQPLPSLRTTGRIVASFGNSGRARSHSDPRPAKSAAEDRAKRAR